MPFKEANWAFILFDTYCNSSMLSKLKYILWLEYYL